MKLGPFVLIIGGASNQHKRLPRKVFMKIQKYQPIFELWFVCVLLWVSTVNPTYEPLLRFVIAMIQVNLNMTVACMA